MTFEEAVRGCQKEIEIPRWETCPNCHGNGAQPGTSTQRCPNCQGSGEIRRVQQSIFGQFVNVMVCDRCRGEGRIITTPCERCHGQGRVRNVRRVTVNIPAGVDDGINVRVTGEGEAPPRGGTPGNLYVALSRQAARVFQAAEYRYHSTSCRSPSPRRRWAPRSRFQRSTAKRRSRFPPAHRAGASSA